MLHCRHSLKTDAKGFKLAANKGVAQNLPPKVVTSAAAAAAEVRIKSVPDRKTLLHNPILVLYCNEKECRGAVLSFVICRCNLERARAWMGTTLKPFSSIMPSRSIILSGHLHWLK